MPFNKYTFNLSRFLTFQPLVFKSILHRVTAITPSNVWSSVSPTGMPTVHTNTRQQYKAAVLVFSVFKILSIIRKPFK